MCFTIGCVILLLGTMVPLWMGCACWLASLYTLSVLFVLWKRGVGLHSGLNWNWKLRDGIVKYQNAIRHT